MSMSDPVADMLTQIRNALQARKSSVAMPASNLKSAIAEALKSEGYIKNYRVDALDAKRRLLVELKYFQGHPVIEEIKRVSSPGCRVYARSSELPQVRGGLGVALVSTSKGVMTDKSAREQGLGGEVLCTVF